MSSHFKYYFGFVVEEFFEIRHTCKISTYENKIFVGSTNLLKNSKQFLSILSNSLVLKRTNYASLGVFRKKSTHGYSCSKKH